MRNIGEILQGGNGEIAEVIAAVNNGKLTSVFGLTKSDGRLLCCGFERFVYVCTDVLSARTAYVEFAMHYPTARLLLPKNNVILASGASVDGQRAKALYDIACGKCSVVVTTSEALLQILPTRDAVKNSAITFVKNEKYRYDDIPAILVRCGYKRVGHVDEPSTFAVRGDILDVCTPSGQAARIEFFGSEVERIRNLDTTTQRADGDLGEFTCYGVNEIVGNDIDELVDKLTRLGNKRRIAGLPVEHKIAESLKMGNYDGADTLLSLVEHTTLDEFCGMPIIIEDAKAVYDACVFAYREHSSRAKRLVAANEAPDCVDENLTQKPNTVGAVLCFHSIDSANRFFEPKAVYKFKSIDLPNYGMSYQKLADDILRWQLHGNKVCVCVDIKKALDELNVSDVEYIYATADGGAFFSENLIVIGLRNVGMKRDPFEAIRRTGMKELPKPGDYVVHEKHGIGICEAVGAVDFGEYVRDYITIKYAGGDTLYVPVENMSRLSKYDFTDSSPKLSKIGGGEFGRVKARVKDRLKKMAFDLLELYAKRESSNGKKYSEENTLYDAFAADFKYTETPDQLTAIDECIRDLNRGKIMDRLICGDVGFGKTEVALRVAFKVLSEGGQVAFLSPTTVLCHQHYKNTVERMEKFGAKVAAFSRTEPNEADTLKGLADGSIDIVCGTHKLLGNKVKFKNLELLILDEEQKFGVSDKEKIKNLKADVNVLTLSATPIPRTLHMALSGIRDVSMLETPPTGRLPAQVYVTEYSDALLVDAIARELERGGQVFVVYNYVNASGRGIAEYTARLAELMPEVKFVYAHGQMEKKQMTKAVEDFASGKFDVLVATTIIENGVDIPNANTMVVYGAENMGLSQLYQLKGRVGRSDRVAQVYFTYGNEAYLTPAALERLEAIARYTDLGSGVKIAEQDMRIRGIGNVFGAEQHGHVVSVGYAMYCQLLNEVVAEIKGERLAVHADARMHVDFTAVIPKDFCDSAVRVELYKRISNLASTKERDELFAELKEAYETVPTEIKNLANVGLVKNLASKYNAINVKLLRSGGKIEFSNVADIPQDYEKFGGTFSAVKEPLIVFDSYKKLVDWLISLETKTTA